MIVFEKRASTILYNVLRTLKPQASFLLPANVCPIVPLTFLKAGAPFEFVDISPDTLCIDRDALVARLTGEPGAYAGVLFVRSYGVESSVDPLFGELKRLDARLMIIDDRCLCIPRISKASEDHADLTLYSTGYGKVLDLGFGGYGFLRDELPYSRHAASFDPTALEALTASYKQAVARRTQVLYKDSDWLDAGDVPLTFADYLERIRGQLPRVLAHKGTINQLYRQELPGSIQLDPAYQGWRFSIIVREKETLLQKIFSEGLFASSHFASMDGIFSGGQSPHAERLHETIVNLFNDDHFDQFKARQVTRIVNEHVQQFRI